jgi:hypothetical protein
VEIATESGVSQHPARVFFVDEMSGWASGLDRHDPRDGDRRAVAPRRVCAPDQAFLTSTMKYVAQGHWRSRSAVAAWRPSRARGRRR